MVVGTPEQGLPFCWDAINHLQLLPVPDSRFFAATLAINDEGEVVDYGGADSTVRTNAVLLGAEGMADLSDCIDPDRGWHLMRATAISDRDLIGCDAIRDRFVGAVLLVRRAG